MTYVTPSVAQAANGADAVPAKALILFGANWCAPCLEELRNLPALADAMAPAPLILAWRDGTPPTLWPSWPDNAQFMPADQAEHVALQGGESSAGLPFAILLDASGKRCASLAGKLTVTRIGQLKARCAAKR